MFSQNALNWGFYNATFKAPFMLVVYQGEKLDTNSVQYLSIFFNIIIINKVLPFHSDFHIPKIAFTSSIKPVHLVQQYDMGDHQPQHGGISLELFSLQL